MVELLVNNGAETEVTDDYGNGLVHLCAIFKQNTILKWLVNNLGGGFNFFTRNLSGETALNIATSQKNQEAINILSKIDDDKSKVKELLNEIDAS